MATYQVVLTDGPINHVASGLRQDEIVTTVLEALTIQIAREPSGFTIVVTKEPSTKVTNPPHDFESERGAAEGGLGPCAVCGYSRHAPVHEVFG